MFAPSSEFKASVKAVLKEMLESGELSVDLDEESDYDGDRRVMLKIKLDRETLIETSATIRMPSLRY